MISIIAAFTALVAVIVGPIVSFKIAKRQISASTVTISRQHWINDLRDAIADFNAKASMIYGLKSLRPQRPSFPPTYISPYLHRHRNLFNYS